MPKFEERQPYQLKNCLMNELKKLIQFILHADDDDVLTITLEWYHIVAILIFIMALVRFVIIMW